MLLIMSKYIKEQYFIQEKIKLKISKNRIILLYPLIDKLLLQKRNLFKMLKEITMRTWKIFILKSLKRMIEKIITSLMNFL